VILAVRVVVIAWVGLAPILAQETPDFSREVRPILAENCLLCHGMDEQKGGLRFDTREGALADLGGYAAVVPGELQASELWYRIITDVGEDRMPPEEHGPALTVEQREVLRRWIEAGADWKQHWAFDPISIGESVEQLKGSRLIDEFVYPTNRRSDRLFAQCSPSQWLRRVHFVLTGLPPSVQEQEEFLNMDPSNRRNVWVDRLLDSPHFGERWARHWLDLARYSETRGHEFDFSLPNAWEFRDWLVRGFNQDVGWDQLLKEQIAGDLLEHPRLSPEGWNESILGTAFWLFGEEVHSPVDLEVDRADRTANQLDTFGKSFLGLTLACARCHDHKFDPIPATDYYALAGRIQSASYRQVRFQSLELNQRVRTQLNELHAQESKEALVDALDRFKKQLPRTEALRQAGAQLAMDVKSLVAEHIVADFEHADWSGWTVAGEAFGVGPQSLKQIGDWYPEFSIVGEGFVNSHDWRTAPDSPSADAWTGELTSPEFDLTHDELSFFIAGGATPGCRMELLVGGEAVLQASGANSAELREVVWDLAPWRGQTARVRIIDGETDGWGHIAVDHLILRNRVSAEALANQRSTTSGDAEALLAWSKHSGEPQTSDATPLDPDATLHWQAHWNPWWQDGSAWSSLQKGEGMLSSNTTQPLLQVAPLPCLVADPEWTRMSTSTLSKTDHFDSIWKGTGVTLKTPTVEREQASIWYLVQGKGVVLQSVEDHRLLHGPLHIDTMMNVDTEGLWKWVEHRTKRDYSGLRVHFEFAPENEGIGFAVAAIAEGQGPPFPAPSATVLDHQLRLGARLGELVQASPEAELYATHRSELLAHRRLDSRLAPALLEGDSGEQRLLLRGNPAQPSAKVGRTYLSQFDAQGTSNFLGSGSGRLELTESMLSESKDLLSRVFVNRVWGHVFGEHLVSTPDNFGTLASYPSHPELLDALALRFQQHSWSLKELLRWMVLSDSFGGLQEARRLDAEAIRDSILAVSGTLDPTVGGPSVPIHLVDSMQGRGRPSQQGPLDGEGRRTLYLEVRKNFLSPFLLVWDFPQPSTARGKRSASNVPAQSLALMNDPFVVEQSRRWAETLAPLADDSTRIAHAWKSAFCRSPQESERKKALEFLALKEGGGWPALCQALMQMKEFVYVR